VIAISAVTLVPGVVGGSETYVRELLRGLARVGTTTYRVLLPSAARGAGDGLPTVVVERHRGNRVLAMARTAADPRYSRLFEGMQVVHYPLTVPIPRTKLPTVVTLHDVQHLDLPDMFSRTERTYRALTYDRSAKAADRVLVVSDFVKERAVERLGLDPGRVVVTPLGVDLEQFRPGNDKRGRFLLYPAKPWPHKNHGTLFEAFALLRKKHRKLRLVLTGGGEYEALPDGVEARGHVPRAEVADLMRHAGALVFPSLYEGFGLPPLEAMASGCPVACSDRASLPEVVGDAARLFDPADPKAIAAALEEVLDDPKPWVARGLDRVRAFDWDRTARLTEHAYFELSTRS
jgi:glycosyltransferase involved in cell wall biosynthesis